MGAAYYPGALAPGALVGGEQHRLRTQAPDGHGVVGHPALDAQRRRTARHGTEYTLASKLTKQSFPTERRCRSHTT